MSLFTILILFISAAYCLMIIGMLLDLLSMVYCYFRYIRGKHFAKIKVKYIKYSEYGYNDLQFYHSSMKDDYPIHEMEFYATGKNWRHPYWIIIENVVDINGKIIKGFFYDNGAFDGKAVPREAIIEMTMMKYDFINKQLYV